MSLSNKLARWKEQQFITQEQCDKILTFERTHSNRMFGYGAFIFAGLLIGLGICLIVAANWDVLGPVVKLTGDFMLLGAVTAAAYWSICHQRNGLKELFCIVAFLLIGASIGLVAQIFQLDGGWKSFALFWALLGLPFAWMSRGLFFTMGWWFLLLSGIPNKWLWDWFSHVTKHFDGVCVALIAGLWLLSCIGKLFDEKYNIYTHLAAAFEKVMMWLCYTAVITVAGRWGLSHWENTAWHTWLAHFLVFGFLGLRMYGAAQIQSLSSFKRNAILAEVYLFCIFASRFGDLLTSGIGFIIGGLLVLIFIYILRKTSRYIKNMETFK